MYCAKCGSEMLADSKCPKCLHIPVSEGNQRLKMLFFISTIIAVVILILMSINPTIGTRHFPNWLDSSIIESAPLKLMDREGGCLSFLLLSASGLTSIISGIMYLVSKHKN
jgi:hypothetical protein